MSYLTKKSKEDQINQRLHKNIESESNKYLEYQQEWDPERIGDYLGSKIPSLLEFLENKIYKREVTGCTKIKKS